jgi:hypothetical protein
MSKTEFLRRRRSDLLTPVRDYVHRDSGRRVTVVSTMHIGEADYYARLRDVVTDREACGATVQCEGSSLLVTNEDREAAAGAAREALDARSRLLDLTRQTAPLLGWTFCLDAMPVADTWQIVDISEVEVIERNGAEVILRHARRASLLLDLPDGDAKAVHRFRLMASVGLRAAARVSRSDRERRATPTDAVVLHYRTEVALTGLDDTDRDVVLIWGGRHLPGLDAGLVDRGYVLTSEVWQRVGRLPSVPRAIAGLFTARHTYRPAEDANTQPEALQDASSQTPG